MLEREKQGLFGTINQCKSCGKRLPMSYKDDYCPACLDMMLLQEVKEYIRKNDVNEYQVAEHFGIPLRQVKEWIRDGRIEYRVKSGDSSGTINGIFCQNCGSGINFGTLCPKCLNALNRSKQRGFAVGTPTSPGASDRMHYLDSRDDGK